MKFLKLLLATTVFTFIFTGCTEPRLPSYDLNIISPSFEEIYRYYSPKESETEKYRKINAVQYSELINEENINLIKSITVVDDALSDETAAEITAFCKEKNIPVFFLLKDIKSDILDSYDKAYCLTANYTYIGEKFAEKINEIWQTSLKDRNSDKIFTFTVIKPESFTDIYRDFYSRLIEYIELLGIPLQQLDEIFLTRGDVFSYCDNNKNTNEAFFILQSDYLSALTEAYQPAGDGVEILGIYFGVKNIYTDRAYMQLCFINYTEYFEARDEILTNIDNHTYPFENIKHSIIDKTIHIEPTI